MLSNYPNNYSESKIPSKFGPLDKYGLPLFDSKILRLNLGYIYHPMVIVQYGLAHFELYLQGDRGAYETFILCTNWLQDHAEEEIGGRFTVWYYTFPLLAQRKSPPWISGMLQGQALSLLLRAYQRTGSTEIALLSQQAARAFLYDLDDGGVLSKTLNGNSFIEEYAFLPASHVLNGCLYAMIGLHDYLTTFPDQTLENILKDTVRGVEEVLPDFDLGWWSKYSLGLRWNMATYYYHNVHIQLLNYLGTALDSLVFIKFAENWELYQRDRRNILKRRIVGVLETYTNRLLRLTCIDQVKYVTSKRFI
jgi:heparosan-N-sulfate-glucuronate 5-epimerase